MMDSMSFLRVIKIGFVNFGATVGCFGRDMVYDHFAGDFATLFLLFAD